MLALAILVAFLWALYPFILRYNLTEVDPIVTWTIFSITAAIAGIIVTIVTKKNIFIGRASIPIIIASMLGPVIAMLIYIILISKTDKVSLVIALAFTSPLFAAIIGTLFYKEKLSIKQIAGIAGILIGTTLILVN